MHPNNYIPGGDPNIEELLRQSFLDLDQNNPANDQLFDSASQNVFGKEWPGEVNAQKEAQLLKTKTTAKWVWYMAGFLVTGVITTAVVLYTNNSKNKNIASDENTNTIISAKKDSPLTINNINPNEKQENNTAQDDAASKEVKANSVGMQSGQLHTNVQLNGSHKTNNSGNVPLVNISPDIAAVDLLNDSVLESPYLNNSETYISGNPGEIRLPVLTQSEIESTNKEKQRMIEEATTRLALFYSHISGSGKTGYGDNSFQTAFNLKTTEVSVKEYRTFLNDLIINNRKEEYEKAKPRYEEMFRDEPNSADKKFFDKYFTSSKYKNYPVVFVTPEATQLYCAWLQDAIVKNAKGKFSKVVVRLPNESEWEKAASGGKPNRKYATYGGKIKHFMGDYKANFRATQQNKFSFVNAESSDELAAEDIDTTGIKKGDHKKKDELKNQFTCDVWMYGPNENGLYNMSGNVSEMVFGTKGKMITKGGNWNSPVEFLQIKDFNEFMFVSASPYIGFRPVITFK